MVEGGLYRDQMMAKKVIEISEVLDGPPFFGSLRMQAAIFIFQRFPGFSMLTAISQNRT